MIISRTPLRVSFLGGGSDLPSYCLRSPGLVVSAAIEKSMYISIHPSFSKEWRIAYSVIDTASQIEEIDHTRVRACLDFLNWDGPSLEITSTADVPAKTGLASSSSFTVGLLNVLHRFNGEVVLGNQLAEEAYYVERKMLQEPLGRQDQYITAGGGLRKIQFLSDESVNSQLVACDSSVIDFLSDWGMLFYTGTTRLSSPMLKRWNENISESKFDNITKIVELARVGIAALEQFKPENLGMLIDANWQHKKDISDYISNEDINEKYELALGAGALGGKILGAGGGGAFFLMAPPDLHSHLINVLAPWQYIDFNIVNWGSHVIYEQ